MTESSLKGSVLLIAVCCLWLFTGFATVSDAAVLGIDLGNEFFKVAIVAPGRPFEILLNAHAKRKTPLVVSFAEKSRAFGEDGLAHTIRSGNRVFQHLPALLAFNATKYIGDASSLEIPFPPLHYYPYEYQIDEQRGSIKLKVLDELFASPEEILAHIFSFIRHLALESTGKNTSDCVVTVPSWFGVRQREALRDSAAIAGLNVVALVHDNAAAALQHALDLEFVIKPEIPKIPETNAPKNSTTAQPDVKELNTTKTASSNSTAAKKTKTETSTKAPPPPSTAAPSRLKVFFNVGSYTTQSCVVQYSTWTPPPPATYTGSKKYVNTVFTPTILVKGCAAAASGHTEFKGVGGHLLDFAIADKMGQRFIDEHLKGHTLQTTHMLPPRALKKLLANAVKAKHILSANKDALFSVENLMNDLDFKTKLTRDDMEEFIQDAILDAKPYGQKAHNSSESVNHEVSRVIAQSLVAANVTSLDEVESVELVGGGWRVPLIQSVLDTVTSSKTGLRVNGDEAMALGAAYIAANHSSIFRTKTLYFSDVSTHSYSVNILPLPLSVNDSSTTQTSVLQPFSLESLPAFPPLTTYVREIMPIGSKLSGIRTTTFKANRDINIKLYEDGHFLTSYNILGVEETYRNFLRNFTADDAAENATNPSTPQPLKVSAVFAVSHLGITRLDSATTTYKNLVKVEPPVATAKAKVRQPETVANSTETTTSNNTSTADLASNVTANATVAGGNGTTAETPPEEYVKKRIVRQLNVVIAELGKPKPMSQEEKDAAKKRLAEFEKNDKEIMSREKTRNSLEAYIYSVRDKLSDENCVKVSTEKEREIITSKLAEAEEWLYEDGFNANRTELETRKLDLENLTGAMLERAGELEIRPKLVEQMAGVIGVARSSLTKIKDAMPWVGLNATESANITITDTEKWFADQLDKQNKLPLTEVPVLRAIDASKKLDILVEMIDRLRKTPKPKPTPKPTPQPAPPGSSANGTTTANATQPGNSFNVNESGNATVSTSPVNATTSEESQSPETPTDGRAKSDEL